jgi:hypothetical protein
LPTPFLVVAGFLCGSRTLLGSRLIGGFFLVRNILSGSCLALLGSGSLLDGGLLGGLFDCLATRRCCVAGLTLLSFRGANLYIRDPSFLFEGAKRGKYQVRQGVHQHLNSPQPKPPMWTPTREIGLLKARLEGIVTELLTTLFPSLLSLLRVPSLW